ncbi:EamA family transporter [Streptomyces adelaidensis]|jgi:inner membrane transporter RhtA|uniref:EamA family transporter n=1 Tax=Streptomyces adelaidensis TaxID=2796465 RepID=UPI001F36B4A9|nr:EamA family transporter [Streptomyces adelaidensis]
MRGEPQEKQVAAEEGATRRPGFSPTPMVLGGIVALELGAALAKLLFPLAGVAGVVALRLVFAAVVLLVVMRVSPRTFRDSATLGLVVLIGTLLALHHLAFYAAVDRLPLGVAVTIEFTGPLAIALFSTLRIRGLLWAGLAAVGVCLTALTGTTGPLGLTGVLLAVGAALSWGGYIIVSSTLGRRTEDGRWLTVATTWAAVLTLPLAVTTAGTTLLDPRVLLGCLGVAMLCEVVSYSLQNKALRRMPAQGFSILMSLEPAVAALLGLMILGQAVSAWQVAGIVAVVAASLGNTLAPGR